MKMPIMDGWEFAKIFKKLYGKMSPIVVITAAADAEQRARDIEAIGWITKPFDLDVFLDKVKKFERP
jgi:DNA-binding response OmpR family regulator